MLRLRPPAPYALASEAERAAVVSALRTVFAAADGPVRVRYAPAVESRVWRTELAVRGVPATARAPLLVPAKPAPADVPSIRERPGRLELNDNHHARLLLLTRWPAVADPGWLAGLRAVPAVAAVVLRAVPVPTPTAVRLLRRRLGQLMSSAGVDAHTGRVADPTVALASESAADLWDGLVRGDTAVLRVQVLVALVADAPAALTEAARAVRTELAARSAAVSALWFEQGPGWAACMRAEAPGAGAVAAGWRLVDAATLAASVPWPVGPPDDAHTGVRCGTEQESGAPVRLDRFTLHNGNRLVVGTSGAGKSYASKLEVLRWLGRDASAVVVDPEGEFRALADATGGLAVVVGVDPAGLDPVGVACAPQLSAGDGLALLCSVVQALLGTPPSPVDLALLDRALGVLRCDPGAHPGLDDLVGVIAELSRYRPFTGCDLATRLLPAAAGSLASLFTPNPALVDPPPLVVFDLRAVAGRLRAAVTAAVLGYAWSRAVRRALAERRLVVVDEAHLLLDDANAAALLAQFARRARKYGVGLELVTQRLSDFLAHPDGEAVLASTATKLVLGCEDRERTAVATGLGLTPREADLLRPGDVGAGLLLTPSGRCALRVVADADEARLAAAGPGGVACAG